MVKNVDEEKIKRILTDEKSAAIKAILEKDHAIDCLLLLHLNRGKWKDAKDFMRENKLTLSDGTFRARMIEIESLGLGKRTHRPTQKILQKNRIRRKNRTTTSRVLRKNRRLTTVLPKFSGRFPFCDGFLLFCSIEQKYHVLRRSRINLFQGNTPQNMTK